MAKIGSPKDLKGNALLTGISAVNGTTNLGSNFKTIKNGTNVTLSSSADGVLVVAAGGAITKPATNGTAGQVLKTYGGTSAAYWGDALTTVSWSDVTSKPVVVNALPATSGANGQILRAGANGTIAWQNVSATVANGVTNVVTGGAVYNAISAHENNNTHLPATGTAGYIAVKDTTGYKLVQKIPWTSIDNPPAFITISAVTTLPTTGIKTNVIYLVPNSGTAGNIKDEYIYQNNAWELIGTTEVDLSDLEAHVSSSAIHVPDANTGDNGQVLKLVGGVPKWDTDLTADGSAVLPSYNSANAGQMLQVKTDGTGTQWANAATGDMTRADYVVGTSAVKSAVYATTAGTANAIAGNKVTGTVASATYATTAGTANGVAGANVTGTVASATYATTAGTMTGIDAYVQKSRTINGKNLSNNVTLTGSDIKVDGANGAVTISAKLADLAISIGNAGTGDMKSSVYVTGTGVVKSATYATTAGTANSVAGANVTGTVASATYATTAGTANSVAGANVTGTVASATYATTAGTANGVAGNKVTGTVSSATYATTAGTANGVAGANVTGTVASATYATTAGTANGVAGNKVTGTVSSATYATTAGTANNVNNKTMTLYTGANDTTNKYGQFTTNQSTDSSIVIPYATTGRFGVIKVGNGLGITNGVLSATNSVTISNAVTSNGTNAVAGSAIYSHVESRLLTRVGYDEVAQVAFTGDFNDLTNKPSWATVSPTYAENGVITSMVAGTNVTLSRTGTVLTINATGGGGSVTVDSTITSNGTNPVAGKAIWSAISSLAYQISQL